MIFLTQKKLQGPALIAAAILAWALLLWFFSINNPSFLPIARAIFIVLILPQAVTEWIKMKALIGPDKISYLRWGLSVVALAAWYFMVRG